MNVRFPGLGLNFELRRWAFEIFGLPIYWYGIIIALAFLTAVVLGLKNCRKYDLEPDNILDLVLFAAPAAIVGARLYYVIFSWDQYKDNLIDILKVRDGGLAVYGGVIAAVLVAWIYARAKKMSFLNIMDFGAPYIVLGQGIGRWGNFVNQEAFGTATQLPWRMNGDIPDKYLSGLVNALDPAKWGVHPTFLYESLWDFAVFFFLIWYRKRKKLSGEVLFLYLILYGTGRCLIEGLRTDSLYLGSIRVSQLLSALLVLVFIVLFIYRRHKNSKASEEEPVALGQSQYGSLLSRMKQEESEDAAEGLSIGFDKEGEVSARDADTTAGEAVKDSSAADDMESDEEANEETKDESTGKEK